MHKVVRVGELSLARCVGGVNEHSSKGRELSAAGVGGGRRGRVDERVAAHVPGRAHIPTNEQNKLIIHAAA